jgi:hypothetical protein
MYGKLYMSTQLQTVQRSYLVASSLRCEGVFERGMDLVTVNRKQK